MYLRVLTLDADKKSAIKANPRYSGQDHIAERIKAGP